MASKRVSEKKVVVSSGAAPAPRKTAPRRTARSAKAAETVADAVVENPSPVSTEPVAPELVATDPVAEQPSKEAIAALAYSYWLVRNCQGGSPEEDWLRAEQELRSRNVAAAVA